MMEGAKMMPPECLLDEIIKECERWGTVIAIESNDWEGEVLYYLKEYRRFVEDSLRLDALRFAVRDEEKNELPKIQSTEN